MKKIISTLILGLACTIGVQAQEYNLFYDVDADGWLWFDSQEKIDKYVGLCNEADNKIDPNGKIIQMVPADIIPDYPPPMQTRSGKAPEKAVKSVRKVSAREHHHSCLIGHRKDRWRSFVVLMPSCSTFSICLSREGQTCVRMMASKNINTVFTNYDVISAKYALPGFSPLFRSGIFTWKNIETLDNNNGGYNLQSTTPIYAYFQSATADPIYIHGIRVTTPTNSTVNIKETIAPKSRIFFEGNRVVLNETADIKVYNANGLLMNAAHTDRMDLSNMPKGIYIVKAGDSVRKLAVQ